MSQEDGPKVVFASAEWVARAEEILVELVQQHGEPGKAFSVCEVFTNAPRDLSPDGVVSWHFQIEGTSVRVGMGEIGCADLCIRNTYTASLPIARMIYTPQNIAEVDRQATKTSSRVLKSSEKRPPTYLIELHNRLAKITE